MPILRIPLIGKGKSLFTVLTIRTVDIGKHEQYLAAISDYFVNRVTVSHLYA